MNIHADKYGLIGQELQIRTSQVAATVELLHDGASIPFICRYRKEATGSLDEVQVTAVRDRLDTLIELDKRRKSILDSLAKRDLLSPDVQKKLDQAKTLAKLEDIYLPHKLKRRTRAMMASEKGLEPLAKKMLHQQENDHVSDLAEHFLSPEKGVESIEDALAGARDILAEWVSENEEIRARLRKLFTQKAVLSSTVVKKREEEGQKFRDYFSWQELAGKAAGHRVLAMFRGEKEKVLSLTLRPAEEQAISILLDHFLHQNGGVWTEQVTLALTDSYKRLLAPSLEKELRNALKEQADQEAITVFAENLRELFLAAPLGQKRVMALDPGYRTGAKLVCLDAQGNLLHSSVIYPTIPGKQEQARTGVRKLVQTYEIEAIAIGNGTAGRETEAFIRELDLGPEIVITLVNEDGASIYSASEVARREFPHEDVTVRGAVSIGRRLQDPLAELVKLDPKSIGVGQYQHDVHQASLKKALEDVVSSCVNSVGVDLNSASLELLTFVSGLGPALAASIIAHRQESGPFTARTGLKKVARLGPKAFEQCAGFLRIHGAKNPLDASAVHPERYSIVKQMAKDTGCTVAELMASKARQEQVDIQQYTSASLGVPTLRDIMTELAKPGRDPRERFAAFSFAEDVHSIKDLIAEMRLPGIITNVTKFGAFVDIGVKQDGLIHISQLADRFISDPNEVVRVRQQVQVRVLEVDQERKRIALSLKEV